MSVYFAESFFSSPLYFCFYRQFWHGSICWQRVQLRCDVCTVQRPALAAGSAMSLSFQLHFGQGWKQCKSNIFACREDGRSGLYHASLLALSWDPAQTLNSQLQAEHRNNSSYREEQRNMKCQGKSYCVQRHGSKSPRKSSISGLYSTHSNRHMCTCTHWEPWCMNKSNKNQYVAHIRKIMMGYASSPGISSLVCSKQSCL